jgi:hypothetical protein
MTPLLTTVATYAVALAGVGGFLRILWAANRRIHKIIDVLDFMEAEMKPNHGSSLRDAIDRVETGLTEHIKYHMNKGEIA